MAEILTVTNKAGYRSSYLELKMFCSFDIAITHWRVKKKISAQLVKKWLRYLQLKVCVVGGWWVVGWGGFQCIAWSRPQSGLAVTIIIHKMLVRVVSCKYLQR